LTIALLVLTLVTGALAALVPAVIAARRDPLAELRVP
jgi:ABC-type antimicrobial peptide transport system permease subunit